MAYCHMAIWQVVTWFLLVVIFALEPLCANEDGQDHFEICILCFGCVAAFWPDTVFCTLLPELRVQGKK